MENQELLKSDCMRTIMEFLTPNDHLAIKSMSRKWKKASKSKFH